MCWVGVADIDLPIYPNYTIVRTCTITLYGEVLVWLYVVFFYDFGTVFNIFQC